MATDPDVLGSSRIVVVGMYTKTMANETGPESYVITVTVPGSRADDGNLWMGGTFNVARLLQDVFNVDEISENATRWRDFMARIRFEKREVVAALEQVSREFRKANVPYWIHVHMVEGRALNGNMTLHWAPGMSSSVIYFENRFEDWGVDWESALGAVRNVEPPQREKIEQELMHGYVEMWRAKRYSELDMILGG